MSGKHLLDTNIIIAIFKSEPRVLQHLAAASDIRIPVIALGELFYGAQHSGNVQKNLAQVQTFAAQANLLICDAVTADIYGQIKNELKQKGNPIPENDVWIAALGRQHGLTLVSRDQHFVQVPGLPLEVW
jgi:tRNA(fMet)-specific endonuclease VapC